MLDVCVIILLAQAHLQIMCLTIIVSWLRDDDEIPAYKAHNAVKI